MTETIKRYVVNPSYRLHYRTMKSALHALGLKPQREGNNHYRSFNFIRDMSNGEISELERKLYGEIAKKYHPDVVGFESYYFTQMTNIHNHVQKLLKSRNPRGQAGWDAFYMTEQGGYKE